MKAGDQENGHCSRCKRTTLHVRDEGPGWAGWICSRCMEYTADRTRRGQHAGRLALAIVLLALILKAILTHVPQP